MAGEVTKTTNLTNVQASPKTVRDNRYRGAPVCVAMDEHQFAAATELEAADTKIFDIEIPSDAVVLDILIRNDDMDTDASPTLTLDVGLVAGRDYSDVTSSTVTKHDEDDLIDVDLFVDGSTEGQSANTDWTSLAADTATWGVEDSLKPVWEMLGYDEDPHTEFRLALTSAAAATALASAADCALMVKYVKP